MSIIRTVAHHVSSSTKSSDRSKRSDDWLGIAPSTQKGTIIFPVGNPSETNLTHISSYQLGWYGQPWRSASRWIQSRRAPGRQY